MAATAQRHGRLKLESDLTIYHALEQKTALLAALADSDVLELDLALVSQIDTAGIQMLILAKRESLRLNHSLNMIGHSPAVHEAIDFLSLGGYFGDPMVIKAQ